MKKEQFEKGAFIVGSKNGKPGLKNRQAKKETPEEMIRSLQGLFCKGRYHSWIAKLK